MSKIIALSILLTSLNAFATVSPEFPRGESINTFNIPGKAREVCVIPSHIPGGKYSKKDLEREQDLCSYEVGVNIAACPKVNSSNPGIDFYSAPEGITAAELQANNCVIKIPGSKKPVKADKEAKYKLSTSCSYTPSLLAYYHFSRALGDIANVPVAVMRTMDLERHIYLGEKALATIPEGELIGETWRSLLSALKAGRDSKKRDLLFTDNFDQSYGALQKNPKGEEFYSEFFNKGTDRVAAFRDKNPIYKSLTNVNFKIGREFTQENVQTMQQLRDAADMILLDTILGQQDRFGNIHNESRLFYHDGTEVKSEKKLEDIPAPFAEKAVQAKVMLLKDNDCGVAKENRIKAAKLLDRVAHMNPKTYKKLLALEQNMNDESNSRIFRENLLFTNADFKTVSTNLREAVAMLKASCKAGRLKLDLDMDAHFSGAELPATYTCE